MSFSINNNYSSIFFFRVLGPTSVALQHAEVSLRTAEETDQVVKRKGETTLHKCPITFHYSVFRLSVVCFWSSAYTQAQDLGTGKDKRSLSMSDVILAMEITFVLVFLEKM